MPVSVLRPGAAQPPPAGTAVRCALVNNMPDPALVQTERQFLGLLEAGSGDRAVVVRRYGLAGVPRGERAADYMATEYFPVRQLWHDEPQALIVTGSEPLSASLAAEPYWDELVDLLARAVARPTTVLLSCLAAHAALLAMDGLDRRPLPAKCFGVFAHHVRRGPLTAGMDQSVPMPHSRLNDIPADAVVSAGWDVLLSSPTGWGAATARRDRADVLLVQGHPEYGPDTLVREWRRDLGRWARRERPDVPAPPIAAVHPDDLAGVADLYHRLRAGEGGGDEVESFPFDAVGTRAVRTWRPAAETLYANWLAGAMPAVPARDGARTAGH